MTALDLWGRFQQRRKTTKKLVVNTSIDLGFLSRSISAPDGLQHQLRVNEDMIIELKNENDRRLKQLDEVHRRHEGQITHLMLQITELDQQLRESQSRCNDLEGQLQDMRSLCDLEESLTMRVGIQSNMYTRIPSSLDEECNDQV